MEKRPGWIFHHCSKRAGRSPPSGPPESAQRLGHPAGEHDEQRRGSGIRFTGLGAPAPAMAPNVYRTSSPFWRAGAKRRTHTPTRAVNLAGAVRQSPTCWILSATADSHGQSREPADRTNAKGGIHVRFPSPPYYPQMSFDILFLFVIMLM